MSQAVVRKSPDISSAISVDQTERWLVIPYFTTKSINSLLNALRTCMLGRVHRRFMNFSNASRFMAYHGKAEIDMFNLNHSSMGRKNFPQHCTTSALSLRTFGDCCHTWKSTNSFMQPSSLRI